MAAKITRHMATIRGERQVHYRRAGSGPPVILLHQSPNSSQEYIPLIEDLANDYTVIAPDTPGNGLSDPLELDSPVMTDYAQNVADLMDVLGIEKCPVYGFHTGAVCSLELAWRHPEKLTVGVVNGYVNMPKDLVAEILENYFVPLEYNWSGSHLTWTWARFREQLIFFPWYRTDLASRMDATLPPPERLQTAVIEFLRSGPDYRKPYRAAFTQDANNSVKEMQVKCIIMSPKTDVLYEGLDRMPAPSDSVEVYRPDTGPDAIDILKRVLKENPSPKPAPSVVKTEPVPGKLWGEYVQVGGGSLYCRRNTDGSGRPILFIHASASSSFSMDRYMEPLIGTRPVLAIDLPGNGESENPMGTLTVEKQASFLAEAVHALGYDEVDVFGTWGGGTVAVELAVQHPDLVKHVAVPSIMAMELKGRALEDFSSKYTPDIPFDDFGGHWIFVWNMVRDQELFNPWFERKAANISRFGEPDIDPEVIQRRTLDLFKAYDIYQAAYKAHFSYPMSERLPKMQCPLLLGGPESPMTKSAVASGPADYTVKDMPANHAGIARTIVEFFDS
ncbi:MAG: alpha/beta fold hydrolase [Rhodospirillaceae bacterium]|jgi:pimeloyl-ACP methyl ester carboxylesterase